MDKHVDVAIIGAGSAGLSAAGEVKKKTDNFLIINSGHYGTTCARVGCMPSKVLIMAADDFHRRERLEEAGILGGEALHVDKRKVMSYVRSLRDFYVSSVMEGMSGDKTHNLEGQARFIEPTVLDVDGQIIRARKVIIATGSKPVFPKAWEPMKSQLITSDDIFEMETLPDSAAIIGLGVIGLELGQAMARLGVNVVGMGSSNTIAGISDPVILEQARENLEKDFPMFLNSRAELSQKDGKILAKSGSHEYLVDKVLLSMGRRPNLEALGLEDIGVPMDNRNIPVFDSSTMQIKDMPIYIAGDVVVDRAILHEASDEGRIAGYNAVHEEQQCFRRRIPMGICFSDPNIGFAGFRYGQIKDVDPVIGEVSFKSQGRARAMRRNNGHARLYASRSTGKLLGAEMVAPSGEHLIHLLTWSIQMQQDVFGLLRMPFYHPVVEEGLRTALRSIAKKIGGKRSEFEMSECYESCIDPLC
ncbi:MAG: dihydrolipoyl dehydrogenase [Proteobacteria bacterium]|nr:dihydrolipoyl dehydrogenase [Pseudomonadota bacterium]